MASLKIFNVVGARPQFVKMAMVSRALRKHRELQEVIIHSGQHADAAMSQVFFDELDIPFPDHNLGISGTGSSDVVAQMESGLTALIEEEKPDWVLVYGDTYTTRAAAQAAHHSNIPIAHVEAGLRSFNPEMPEELNRIVADRLSTALFAPSQRAVDQLWEEGLSSPEGRIMLVGDVMKDAADYYSPRIEEDFQLENLPTMPFLLCTVHRAETTDDREKLAAVVNALNQLSQRYSIVLPLHPRTEKRIKSYGLGFVFPTHPPQGYPAMLHLLKKASLVVTDSGGLQKEAYFMHRFCVTLRNETEWTELVDSDYNLLVGTDEEKIIEGVETMLQKSGNFDQPFYGDGNAAEKIAAFFAKQAKAKG